MDQNPENVGNSWEERGQTGFFYALRKTVKDVLFHHNMCSYLS